MGESPTCLVRSFSQPAGTSSEPKEGDPFCALTTSISFGRFMSESLAWEKWSCFSNNRYLEEAEKYSKPGSVAQKKAYFEAHYKKIAAKKAAALLEQQNVESNDLSEPHLMDEDGNNSSLVSESLESDGHVAVDEMPVKKAPNTELVLSVDANAGDPNVESNTLETDGHVAIDEMPVKEAPNTELALSVDANAGDPNVESNTLETDKVEEAELTTEQLVIAESTIQVELPNQHENVEKHSKIVSTRQEKKMPIMDASYEGNISSTSKKKQPVSSSKSFTNIRTSKLRSSLKLSPVQSSKEGNTTRISKKTARDSVDKRRSTPKSLHMSINFSSHAGDTSKTSSPIIHKIGNPKNVRTFVKTSKDSSNPPRTPIRASVNGLPVHSSATPQPEKRAKTLDDCSVSGRTADGNSHGIDHLKTSGVSGHKARPPMVPSSFSLRCEERAAKRKEKLEEKLNAKGAERVHLQAKYKEKAENGFKKMCQSTVFRARSIANSHSETKSPSDCMKKIPLTRPRSPKLGRKPIPSMVQDTGFRPPWRNSVKINGSKEGTEKSVRNSIHSLNSLLRKNMNENTSPNIQL